MIDKAVIPVAGLGTRLLPLTKALPKEMLPIGDKPILEHTVRELVDSGIEDIVVVISLRKSLIQNHFAPDNDLERYLHEAGKRDLAEALQVVSSLAHITYIYQDGPYGNGTPVLNAARTIGNDPFIVLWADDLFVADVPRAQQLRVAFEKTGAAVLALMPIDPGDTPRYGVPIVEEDCGEGLMRISGIVEKPSPSDAPSSYAAIGGYVVTPGIVAELQSQAERWTREPEGEFYLSDALHTYAAKNAVYGQIIRGTWYDTGTPLNYLRAQFAAALAHPEYGPELRKMALATSKLPAQG